MNLETWAAVSRKRSNAFAAAATAILMASLLLGDHGVTDRAAFLGGTATLMIVLHAAWHAASLVALHAMRRRGVANATLALAFYRDPRRISHLDLAVVWLVFQAAIRYAV